MPSRQSDDQDPGDGDASDQIDLSAFPFEAGNMFFGNNFWCGFCFAIHFLHDAKTGHGALASACHAPCMLRKISARLPRVLPVKGSRAMWRACLTAAATTR